jgi:3-hydroxybutyryl-CoA dehydratase
VNTYRWEQLQVGLTHSFAVTITQPMVERFVQDTGDANPLHTNDDFARAGGFEQRVVHGLLVASFFSTLVGVHLPGERALLHGVNASFHRPVYVGMPLVIAGEITHLSEAYRRIDITASIQSQGALLVKAKIQAGLRD